MRADGESHLPEEELKDLGRRQALDGGLNHALVSHGEALLQQALVSGLQRLGGEREREIRPRWSDVDRGALGDKTKKATKKNVSHTR